MKRLILLLVAFLTSFSTLRAQMIVWAENRVLTGDDPVGTVTVSFSYSGSGGLRVEADLAPGEYLTYLKVEIPQGLFLIPPETRGNFTWPSIDWDNHSAPGGLSFPLEIKFATDSRHHYRRFDETDMVAWNMATPTLGPELQQYADWVWVGQIKGIGLDGEGSGWIGHFVPEPTSYATIFALGLAGLIIHRRLRR